MCNAPLPMCKHVLLFFLKSFLLTEQTQRDFFNKQFSFSDVIFGENNDTTLRPGVGSAGWDLGKQQHDGQQ